MSYKIYTYTDPYRIMDADFWPEISRVPHLCSSRTLVNGLIDVMQSSISSLICPLDEIIDDKNVFCGWTKNIAQQIQQFGYLTKVFDDMHDSGVINDLFYGSLKHNQNSMLEALRLFIELDISASSLHQNAANKEQKLFIQLLLIIQDQHNQLFTFPPAPTLGRLKDVLLRKANKEKDDFEMRSKEGQDKEYYKKRLAMYERGIESTADWNGKKLVIHGVHQFSPVQLRFIIAVEKLGVDIIFLHNYQEEFQAIYSSWDYIYQFFGVAPHKDANIKRYHTIGQMPSPGRALAKAMALMCEDGISKTDTRFRQSFELYKEMSICCFENISEYAGYISDHIDETRSAIQQQQPLYEQPYKKIGTATILRHMDELVYTANKDVEELLHLYYPEYSRDKHFLSYPIGQFFAALYRLWDWKAGEIRIEYADVRECLNSGILTKYPSAELLKTAINLEPLFENVTSYLEFITRLNKKFFPQYNKVSNAVPDSPSFSFRSMTIYQSYKVSLQNIRNFIDAVTEINEIAKHLFITEGAEKNYLSFSKHFQSLEDFIRTQQSDLANREERELIGQLLARFETIRPSLSQSNMEGTFEDLKNGIYFFLKQKEAPDPNWLVKNFEQIDGDILGSKRQNRPGFKKTYHFACVSDKDMNPTVNDVLPWPLTEQFIERAYTPIDLQFQVYYAALCERNSFLRYCLFYGLFYNQCDSKLSYVKDYNGESTEEYNLLRLLGIKEKSVTFYSPSEESSIVNAVVAKRINSIEYNREHMMDMFICPYRYLFDYVLNPRPSCSNDFLYGNLFENVLISAVWRKLSNLPSNEALKRSSQEFYQAANELKPYFPFWRESDFPDLIRRANNYFIHHIVMRQNHTGADSVVPAYNKNHMEIRKHFGKAKFIVDSTEEIGERPLGNFQKLLRHESGSRVYSLGRVPTQTQNGSLGKELLESTLEYLNDSQSPEERVGEWCQNCPNKDICLRPYTVAV